MGVFFVGNMQNFINSANVKIIFVRWVKLYSQDELLSNIQMYFLVNKTQSY